MPSTAPRQANIIYLPIKELREFEGNPRQRTEKVLDRLVKSIREFGFVEPVIIWANARKYGYPKNCILGGHRRIDALKWLIENEGMAAAPVPCIEVKVNGVARAKALNIALNKIGEQFDLPMLKDWLTEIDVGDLDLEVTGFAESDLEELVTRDLHEVAEQDYDLDRLKVIKCPACGHEWQV